VIYLIKHIWVDSLENNIFLAIGYDNIGYTDDEEIAKDMVLKAGVVEGNGWPIRKGESRPQLCYEKVPPILGYMKEDKK
jgi:hypothetical protein